MKRWMSESFKSAHAPRRVNALLSACVLSCFSLIQLLVTLWTVAHQTSLSMRFSRQEYWSGLPFPSLGDLLDPASKLTSPALWTGYLPVNHQGSSLGPCKKGKFKHTNKHTHSKNAMWRWRQRWEGFIYKPRTLAWRNNWPSDECQ